MHHNSMQYPKTSFVNINSDRIKHFNVMIKKTIEAVEEQHNYAET